MPRLHVVFDLDDTLYPERQFAVSGFRAAARWASATFSIPDVSDEMIAMLDAGLLGRIFPTILERHAPGHTPEHVKAFHHAYRTCDPDLALFEDARTALAHYEAQGPIGLITDGTHTMQQRKVRALALEPRFAHIVYTDALGPDRAYFKPHPRPFEVMIAALGGPGDRFAYVGDNPRKDFLAPNALGWTTVQVLRDGGIHDPHHVVDGGAPQHRIAALTELPDLLGV